MITASLINTIRGAASAPAMSGIHISRVSIAATYRSEHDAVLTIGWTFPALASIQSTPMDGVEQSVYSRPADTTLLIPRAGQAPSDMEDEILSAAWALGAWDVRRLEKAPIDNPEKMLEPQYGLASDFGYNPYSVNGQPFIIGARSPESALLTAAIDGYVTWAFIPLSLGSEIAKNRWGGKDKTLNAGLTRDGVPNIGRGPWMRPREARTAHEHIYQLGRAPHGNRSKKNAGRRA
jgi:hypothetical protein